MVGKLAEYGALMEGTKEVVWLKRLLQERDQT
jgi:hypothetical protein